MISEIISVIRRKILRINKYRWDFQYSNGQWDYLRTREMQRIYKARDLLDKYALNGNILEIGCGEGVLFQNISEVSFSYFEGIDISKVAIDKTIKSEKSVFFVADMENYVPQNIPFTVILLNEVLYYSKNPLKLLNRYVKFMEKEGVFIIGMYDTPKSENIWKSIGNNFSELESIIVQQDSKVWIYKVLSTSKIKSNNLKLLIPS
jgi:SAM-dependent methyltransferase